MYRTQRQGLEALEKRFALAVTAAVADGDLVINGDADGPVEIVAVADGAYQVFDNGVLIADETTLQGVVDDIRVNIDESTGADNAVVLDITDQVVDRIYAELGDGTNTLQLVGGSAASFAYRGGDDADHVDIGSAISGSALLRLGGGDNSLVVNTELERLKVRGGDGVDAVTLTSTVARNVSLQLGDGDNQLTVDGDIGGNLKVCAGDGIDTVTATEASVIEGNAAIFLGGGDNTAHLAGSIDGSLYFAGLDGNDSLTTTETAAVADDLSARLGNGDNAVTHLGSVGGDFSVVSQNENDVVDIAETAVIGGERNFGLGEQQDRGRGCHNGRGFGELRLNGRAFGFFFRGIGR